MPDSLRSTCRGVIRAIEYQKVRIPFLKIDRTIGARSSCNKERASPVSRPRTVTTRRDTLRAAMHDLELSGGDRRHLRSLAHALDPVVQIGAAGVTPGVIAALDRALSDHELVKVRITRERDERREIADVIAGETRSALAGLVGHVAVLYRPAREPERRRIALPSVRRRRQPD
jgi:RNA-binding protein